MIALEITLNGKRLKLAGSEDLGVLNAIISATGKLGNATNHKVKNELGYDLFLRVGGLTSRTNEQSDEHLSWVNLNNLKVGDEITIKVIESDSTDDPISSKKVNEEARRLMRAKIGKKYSKK